VYLDRKLTIKAEPAQKWHRLRQMFLVIHKPVKRLKASLLQPYHNLNNLQDVIAEFEQFGHHRTVFFTSYQDKRVLHPVNEKGKVNTYECCIYRIAPRTAQHVSI
jgi:hypothetical protein